MRRVFLRTTVLGFAAALLSACAVGPDFAPPLAPDVATYDSPDETPALAGKTADAAQEFAPGKDLQAAWWELFRNDALNRLVKQTVEGNPDLAAADAALRVAQDNLAAGESAFLPTVDGAFSAQRKKVAPASSNGAMPPMTYALHNASVGVTYSVDLWGGVRRSVEALQARADAAQFEKEAAYLALTSNAVTAALQEAALREQIAAARAIVADQQKIYDIFKLRFEAGSVAKSAVLAQQASLAQAKAALPPLEHRLAATRHALKALMGKVPAENYGDRFDLAALTLPQQIPLSVPSKLVEQRPDIRAAQENMHAASAAIGVAVAARLPNLVLSGDLGSLANTMGKLLTPGNGFWDLGAQAGETLFDAGALADKEQAARDAYDAASAQYRKTVIAAFQDVADALHALQSDAESLKAKTEAEQAASEALVLTKAQFAAGAIGAADLLLAEQAEQQAKAALAQARATRFADTAALFAALGGGWWNRAAEAPQNGKETL